MERVTQIRAAGEPQFPRKKEREALREKPTGCFLLSFISTVSVLEYTCSKARNNPVNPRYPTERLPLFFYSPMTH